MVPGLVMANAKPDAASKQAAATAATKTAPHDLEAEPDSALPVPKQHSHEFTRSRQIAGH